MRRDIRREILQTARALFNERGFNAVSTWDIAKALNISKGNLTYYFQKKEEIIEAILAENPYAPKTEPLSSLEELNAFFLEMQHVVQENAFYFWHHAQLSQLSHAIRLQQHSIYLSNSARLMNAFRSLEKDGVILGESFPGEYAHMTDTLLLSAVYWMPFCDLTMKHDSGARFQSHAWSVVRRLLTDKGLDTLSGLTSS